MAAYAAVISLNNTIQHILDSSRISLVHPSREIIQVAHEELELLQKILKSLDSTSKAKSRKKVNALDVRIKEVVWKLEDSLESHLSDQILSQFESSEDERDVLLFSIDRQALQHDVDSFIETVKDMEKEYIYELENLPDEEEDESISSRIGFGGMKPKMVRLSDQFRIATDSLIRLSMSHALDGMAGVGKTTLAWEIFEDPLILSNFEFRAWVRVGRKYRFDEIGRCILAQVDPNTNQMLAEVDKIVEYLRERLEGKKCLIVLDDVWDVEVVGFFQTYFSDKKIQILLTTRLRRVAQSLNSSLQLIRFLNLEESKDLLREKVFGEDDFPPRLKKAAKKIAKNCDGLPLMIVAVADHLSKAKTNRRYWDKVAKKKNSVFTDAYNEIEKVLYPSYDYLSQYLKMFFLYMGVFPQDCNILYATLIEHLTAEGFLELNRTYTASKKYLRECFDEVVLNSLVIVKDRFSKRNLKSWRLHSSWWHLCKGEAWKNKFFHHLNTRTDGLEENIKAPFYHIKTF